MSLWSESAKSLALAFGWYGPVDVYRAGVLHTAAVMIGVFIPGDRPSREARATDHTWMVQGAEDTPELHMMALSEVML
jgi:hypothetical protein